MSGNFLVHKLRDRPYWLYLPSTAAETNALPLLLMLHGCNQTAVEFAQGTRMNQQAQRRRFAVLYPEQDRSANTLRCWNWFESDALAGRGDASLIAQTLQEVLRRYPIDAAQIHLVGFSAGAAMAAVLCTTHSHLFAGCAMHSGIMAHAATNLSKAVQIMRRGAADAVERSARQIVEQSVHGSRLVPRLLIHGSEDSVVHPVNTQQIVQQLQLVAMRLNPTAPAPLLDCGQWLENDGRRYRQQSMKSGPQLLVRSLLIEGLGHAWSGGDSRHEFFDPVGPDATRLILDFLLPPTLHAAG
jgi:poly(hydroxyalkanoate) depolymerase family esterase